MNKETFQFSKKLNTTEWRHCIYKAVNYFVCRSREKMKNSPFRLMEEEPAKKLLEKYKFIYNRTSEPNMELCRLLVNVASDYIDYIEDTLRAKLQFPFDCDVLFDLELWFDEIDIKNRYTEEIMILLINKLYNSTYSELILS